jgi:large subunit ribosomal protein L3
MTIGVIGRKAGMTRIFTEAGETIPVTVIEVRPNRVSQVKSLETDGYRAVQVAFGSRRPSRVTKPMAGHYRQGRDRGRGVPA